jgi:hypothetical protein
LETGKKKKISTSMRLFAPAISPDETHIVAIEIDNKSTYNMVSYSIQDKQWSEKITLPQGEYALAPTWNANGTRIAYVGVSSKGKRLVEYNILTQEFTEILPYSTEDLRSPVYFKNYILYTSSYSGIDNVYAVHTETKQQWRVTVSEFGAQFPRVYNEKITFSDYSATGFCVGSLAAEPHTWHSKNAVRRYPFPLAETLHWQENTTLNFALLPDTVFTVKKYPKLAHLFNIHSWSPFYLDYSQNTTNIGIGVQAVSQNKLATAISRFGYKATFDSSPLQAAFASFRYTGFFPIIDLEIEAGKQEIPITESYHMNFGIVTTNAALSFPFILSHNGYNRSIVLQSQLGHSYIQPPNTQIIQPFSSIACKYTAVFSNMSSLAPRDLYAPWGQRLEIAYLHNPYSTSSHISNYAYAQADFYIPSLFKNHSIHCAAAFDWHENENALLFSREIFVPRGCEAMIFDRKDMFATRVEYTLPLWYPDIAWRAMFYCKRLWTTAFVDYARTNNLESQKSTHHYTSYGFDLNAEMHLLHFRAPITAGVRSAFVHQTQKLSCMALLSFNFGAI